MSKYILVYAIKGYPEDGGGIYEEEFGMDENLMHERVNALASQHKECFMVVHAGFLQVEFKYNPVDIITKYEPEQI